MTRLEVAKAKLRRFWMGRPGRPMVLPAGQVVTGRTFISWGTWLPVRSGRRGIHPAELPEPWPQHCLVVSLLSAPGISARNGGRGVVQEAHPSPQHAHTSRNSLPQSCLGVSALTPVTPQGKQDPGRLMGFPGDSGVELPLATLATSPVCTGWCGAVTTPKLLPPVCEQPASRGGW